MASKGEDGAGQYRALQHNKEGWNSTFSDLYL